MTGSEDDLPRLYQQHVEAKKIRPSPFVAGNRHDAATGNSSVADRLSDEFVLPSDIAEATSNDGQTSRAGQPSSRKEPKRNRRFSCFR